MKRNGYLLNRKLYIYILPAVIMALADRVGNILDGIFAGKMISTLAFTAVSVCSPVLLCTMLIPWWIANGCVIQVGLYLGKDKTEEASNAISISLVAGFLISIVIAAAVFFNARPLSLLLTNKGDLQPMVEAFLRVSMAGLPFETLYAVFICCLGVDNYPHLGMAMVLVVQSISVIGDIIVLTYTDWGVAGIAFTSQLGYFVSLLVLIPYIFGKYRVLKYHIAVPGWRRYLGEVMHAGLSNAVGNVVSIKDIIINTVVVTTLGSELMSVYSVCQYASFMERALTLGLTSVVVYTGGILYGEKDYYGLKAIVRKIIMMCGILTFALFALVEIRPQLMAGLYGFKNAELTGYVEAALRIYAFSFVFTVAEDFIQRYYPVIERNDISTFFEAVFNCAIMLPSCIIGVLTGGINGLCFGVVIGGILSIAATDIYRRIVGRHKASGGNNIFAIEKTSPKMVIDITIENTVAQAVTVSEKLMQCCDDAGFSKALSYRMGLAAEEIATSIAMHGSKDTNRSDYIDISLSRMDDVLIMRFRDDGVPYDPVYSIQEKHLITDGIELVKTIASKYSYQRILNLNNTFIEMPVTEKEAS